MISMSFLKRFVVSFETQSSGRWGVGVGEIDLSSGHSGQGRTRLKGGASPPFPWGCRARAFPPSPAEFSGTLAGNSQVRNQYPHGTSVSERCLYSLCHNTGHRVLYFFYSHTHIFVKRYNANRNKRENERLRLWRVFLRALLVFIYLNDRKRESKGESVCWIIPQTPTAARTVWSLEHYISLNFPQQSGASLAKARG